MVCLGGGDRRAGPGERRKDIGIRVRTRANSLHVPGKKVGAALGGESPRRQQISDFARSPGHISHQPACPLKSPTSVRRRRPGTLVGSGRGSLLCYHPACGLTSRLRSAALMMQESPERRECWSACPTRLFPARGVVSILWSPLEKHASPTRAQVMLANNE